MRFHHLVAAACAVAVVVAAPCIAQTYPTRSIRLVVPFPPGGGADIFARLIGKKMSESMGQQFVVDNRGGAAGIIGCELVAHAPPDGYTLLMATTGTHTTNPAVFAKLPYDPIKDFAPVSIVADSPFVLLVHPSVPARNVKELIALAKAHPGELTFGHSGIGSSSHLGIELFNAMAGTRMIGVPYKGLALATADTIAGNITMNWDSITASAQFIKAKRIRALGIGSAKRSPLMPELLTISEAGVPGFELGSWYAIFAPAGTPQQIVRLLNNEIVKALKAPGMKEQFATLGADPIGSTPEALTAVVKRDLVKWAKVARDANVKAE
jgi:tripartite-type tricarboxylate transporter receptor subunit TctC